MDATAVMETVKNVGVIAALIVGGFSVAIHWRTLFAPYSKNIADEEFDVAKSLIEKLMDPMFLVFYTEDATTDSVNWARKLIVREWYSPFLPKTMRAAVKEFLRRTYELSPDAEKEAIEAAKNKMLAAHRKLYRVAARVVRMPNKELPDFNMFRAIGKPETKV